jgi:hypothetical protein
MTTEKRALPSDQYWASVESDELPKVLLAKAEAFRARLENEGNLSVWRRSERTYYGLDGEGGLANSVAVTYTGESDEIAVVRVNHFRSIAQAIIAMVTGARPNFKGRSVNTDVESLRATQLSEGVIDYVYREKRIEDMRPDQTERAVISSEGYLHLRWDIHAGRTVQMTDRPVYGDDGSPVVEEAEVEEQTEEETFDPTSGRLVMQPTTRTVKREQPKTEQWPQREGDVRPEVLGPLEVVRDCDEGSEMTWALVPHRESVWVLAARYPQMRAHLLALRGQPRWPRQIWDEQAFETPDDDDDAVTVWCFYHPPNDALPEGRYAITCGELLLADEPWGFDEIPVYDLVPMRQMGTGKGHSPMWDLLCLQELYDACFTALGSACEGRGMGSVLVPKGSDVSPEMLSRAFQLIEYEVVEGAADQGRPTPLTGLFDSANESSYKILDVLQRTMETLSGINSVTRGDPESNLKSGAALALVQSLSQHFNSTLQAKVTRNDERVATGLLKLYRRFSPLPRLAEIAGQNQSTALKEFTSADLKSVQRVTVEMGNPATRDRGGQLEIALELLRAGAIKDVSQFFEILESGRSEPLFDDDRDEQRLIRGENEALSAGQMVKTSITDRDEIHIRRHTRVLDDPEVRTNPQRQQAAVAHIDEHIKSMSTKSLEIMWAIGQAIPPWRMPGQGAPTEDGAPAEAGAPPPEGGPAPSGEPPAERATPMGQEPPPGGPMMPTNPMTGERVPAGPAVAA